MIHDHGDIREIRDRMRRVETRVTKIGQSLGVDVGGGKPTWDPNDKVVTIPTPNCAIGSILAAIPEHERKGEVDVYIADEYLTTLFVDA